MGNILSGFSKRSYTKIVKTLGIKIVPPEENDNHMKDIVGQSQTKKYLNQSIEIYKNPNDPKNKIATFHHNFLIVGNEGCGKTRIAYTLAKEVNLPIVVINSEKFISKEAISLIKKLDIVLKKHHPAVILLKKFEYLNNLTDGKDIEFFSIIYDYLQIYKDCFFIISSTPEGEISPFLCNKDAFSVSFNLETLDLSQREELLKRFLAKYPHSDINVNKLAKDTLGMNAGGLYILISSAYNQALRDGKDFIDFESLDAMLSSSLYGHQKKRMSDKERKLTAYHEAGHVIAAYFNNPEYKISKVEIAHRSESLGLTISESNEDKLSYTREDFENNIIKCYGGMAAERLIFNTNTSGVSQDLTSATVSATLMVKSFGMNDALGPIALLDEDVCDFSDILKKQADTAIQTTLKKLYQRTEEVMKEHQDALEALTNALLEKEVLYSEEIFNILKNFK